MATIDELIYYCKTEKPVGALALLGEGGCGKTHLVETELSDSLRDSHVIVRVSLFGITDIPSLHDSVKRQWTTALLPLCSKKISKSEQMVIGQNFIKAVNTVLEVANPRAGMIGSAAASIMDDVVVLPEVEDIHTHRNKRVVLVFDDLDRSYMNHADILGVINDYCENRHFHTIVIANREDLFDYDVQSVDLIKKAKEKTIAYTVYDHPDYGEIVPRMLQSRPWNTEEYAVFLQDHTRMIVDIFESDTEKLEEAFAKRNKSLSLLDLSGVPLEKCHNLRSLISGLESFYRIYYHLVEAQIPDIERYFCSYLPFFLANRGGILKDGKISFDYTDRELHDIYPTYDPDNLFDSVRGWIIEGYWNDSLFHRELSLISGKTITCDSDALVLPGIIDDVEPYDDGYMDDEYKDEEYEDL